MTKLTLEFSEVEMNILGFLLYNSSLDQRNLQHLFPAENRRKQNTFPGSSDRVLWTPSKLTVFLFFSSGLIFSFLFLKQTLHFANQRMF